MLTIADRSNLNAHRLAKLKQYALEVSHLDGDVAEVGVWKGGSAKWLCHLFPERKVYLFDTFTGMPAPEAIDGHRQGDFGDTSLVSVRNYLRDCPNAVIVPGVFPHTLPELGPLVLVHVDCDLHSSTQAAINRLWPLLPSGGVMVFDDYKSYMCAGATQAIDDFAEREGVTLEGSAPHEAVVARKP